MMLEGSNRLDHVQLYSSINLSNSEVSRKSTVFSDSNDMPLWRKEPYRFEGFENDERAARLGRN